MLFTEAAFMAQKSGVAFAHPAATNRVFVFVPGREITPSFEPLLSVMGAEATVRSSDHVDTLIGLPNGQFDLLVGSSEFIEKLEHDWGWFLLEEDQLDRFRETGAWNV